MIVGGRWRGLTRAVHHSISFIGIYCLAGFAGAIGLAVVAQDSDLGMAAILLIVATAFSVLVILPAAVVANFIALRVFRPRSWRREPWRAYVAGILAVPFCWGGSYLWLILDVDAPPIVRELGEWGKVILVAGMVILFSNLALLVAWLLPSRKRPATPGGE